LLVFGMFTEEQGVCQINVSHCIAIPTLLQIYYISLFCPSILPPSPAFLQHHAEHLCFCSIFFLCFMVMSLTNLTVSVTQAFTHLAIGMQFSFQALILLYEVMELMRFYPIPPSTQPQHPSSLPPPTSTPPSVENLSVFSLASLALHTRGNLFKDQIDIRT